MVLAQLRLVERVLKLVLKWRVRKFKEKQHIVVSDRLKEEVDYLLYQKYGDYGLVDPRGDYWESYEPEPDEYDVPRMVAVQEKWELEKELRPKIKREVESSMLRKGFDLYSSTYIADEKTTVIAMFYFFFSSLTFVLLEPFALPQCARIGFPILALIVLLVSWYNNKNLTKIVYLLAKYYGLSRLSIGRFLENFQLLPHIKRALTMKDWIELEAFLKNWEELIEKAKNYEINKCTKNQN